MSGKLLNKSVLAEESRRLNRYREFLPALDLKRRQLLNELGRERRIAGDLQAEQERIIEDLATRIPMLADRTIGLDALIAVEEVLLREENRLGTLLPVIERITIRRAGYSLLVKPHWVDVVASTLESVVRISVELDVARERVRRLDRACRVVTRRVNLFEKVLIPRSLTMIRRIRIAVADADRYAAVRGKFVKKATVRRDRARGNA